ncbi:MAG: MarP family serine protease [Chloroflexota bacterium]|nr:MarP family serine protease [Chloroflexota bacterium]
MNFLDLAALAILAVTVALGAWAGLFPQLLGLVGAAGGFGLAILAAGTFQDALGRIDQPMRAFVAASGLVALTLLGEAAGSALGSRVRVAMRERMLNAIDLAGGMLIGFAQGVLAIWIVGGLVLAGALPGLGRAASGSLVLSTINRVLPPPEGVAQQIVSLLAPTEFPNLFAGIEPSPAPPLELPPSGTVRNLAVSGESSTVKVEATGCGREQLGTGFFITEHVVVTNAHVVSGGDTMAVALAGSTHTATLILFDPRQDVALLRVPSVTGPVLDLAGSTPQRGTQAAALGFPGGGGLTVIPAVVTSSFVAEGPDIYDRGTVSRSIVELRAGVRRGDSGGPLLTSPGIVGGIVFGASRADPTVGYAIAASSVAVELREGSARSSPVDSGGCLTE